MTNGNQNNRGKVLQFRRRVPQAVGTFIDSTLKRYGLSDEIARYKFVLYWEEIVGKEMAKRCKPEYLRNGSLIVRVRDSAWANELSFQKELILQRLRKFVGSSVELKDIYFVVGDLKAGNQ